MYNKPHVEARGNCQIFTRGKENGLCQNISQDTPDYCVYLEARSHTAFPRKCTTKHAISSDWIIHILHLTYRKIKCRKLFRDFAQWEPEAGTSLCRAKTSCANLLTKYLLHPRSPEHVIRSSMTMVYWQLTRQTALDLCELLLKMVSTSSAKRWHFSVPAELQQQFLYRLHWMA